MAGIKEEKKIYLVGIYCRLSKDDGTDNESASIATQKSILTDYVKKQGWHIAKTYVDDGYSGTNFQRPSFQNMIKDIESGLINCVITKDLSRLGRNYLDCGLYLEVFFPEHNVRYIAVNDGVDTLNKSATTTSLLSIWLISFSSFLTIYYIDKNKIINRYTRHFVSIIHISYPPQIHTPIQYEYQIAPTPPDQTNPVYPAKTYLLYVLQSLPLTLPENYILPLIWKEMQ
jgi:hypothetical protein